MGIVAENNSSKYTLLLDDDVVLEKSFIHSVAIYYGMTREVSMVGKKM